MPEGTKEHLEKFEEEERQIAEQVEKQVRSHFFRIKIISLTKFIRFSNSIFSTGSRSKTNAWLRKYRGNV